MITIVDIRDEASGQFLTSFRMPSHVVREIQDRSGTSLQRYVVALIESEYNRRFPHPSPGEAVHISQVLPGVLQGEDEERASRRIRGASVRQQDRPSGGAATASGAAHGERIRRALAMCHELQKAREERGRKKVEKGC